MKLKIDKNKLQESISSVRSIISGKAHLPILDNVLISAENGIVTLFGTDLEKSVEQKTGATIEKEGSAVVDAKTLSGVIDSFPGEEKLTLILESNNLKIKNGKSEASLTSQLSEDFPSRQDFVAEGEFEVNLWNLISAIDSVQFSATQDISRPILGSVLVSMKNGVLEAVSTDSYRLAVSKTKAASKSEAKLILPLKTTKQMKGVFSSVEKSEKAKVRYSKNQAEISSGGVILLTRLVNGEYPDYNQVIPKETSVSFSVSRVELQSAVKLSSFFDDGVSSVNLVNMEFDPEQKSIEINATGLKGGSSVSLKCQKTEGEGVKVTLNSQYLMDVLRVVSGDTVEFNTKDGYSPILVKGESGEGEFVIMPLKK